MPNCSDIVSLRLAVADNKHEQVEQILKEDADLVKNYPDIVMSAIDEKMVWILLQLELPTLLTFQCPRGTVCSGKSRKAG